MSIKAIIVSLALCAVGLAAGPSLAAEYYVVKSRSGILMVRDHKPRGAATIVKGPFKSEQEAEKALQASKTGGSNNQPAAK